MKIGILGSSFDPPHIGHVLIARQIKEILKLDEIWLMPCYSHPFNKKLNEPKLRLEMVKFLEEDYVKVKDFEIKKEKVSFSIETLEDLEKFFPNNKFYWIIGSDQLESFKKWKKWKEIIENHGLIIFSRSNVLKDFEKKVISYLGLKEIPKNLIILNTQNLILTNISSTRIRERIKQGKSIKYLVPEKVEEYIIEHKLYK